MIFITTGTQEPFDRLLQVIATFAKNNTTEIVIQAKTDMIFPEHVRVKEFMPPQEFEKYFLRADYIVSHAGMGTIISALQNDKSIIVFPRIAALGEHRNEHQLATARKMKELELVNVAFEEEELLALITSLISTSNIKSSNSIRSFASDSLISSIDEFINK